MAIEVHATTLQPWCVTTYLPNERETQILGGTESHSDAGNTLARTLRRHSARLRLGWAIRFEGELRYPRADGTTGVFYPDVLLALGLQLGPEDHFDIQERGGPPALVVEITSKKTARKDVGPKRAAYAEMGVLEYVTFDPRTGKNLELHGYRLVGRRYVEIPPSPDGGLWLETARLWFRAEPAQRPFGGPLLRLSTRDGQPLLHPQEESEALDAAEEALDAAEQARDTAEQARDAAEEAHAASLTEIARLRRLLSDRDPESTP
ncbi:MAG TPA: Uma2 family endonuclease [Chloroflexota bacterium]|nr:Uma2 family endonuclease [Chloroflexota bacterium]